MPLGRRSLAIALAGTLLLLATNAHAFNGHRKGFVLGFGAGPGYLNFSGANESSLGLQTDLKIGAGLSDQTILHYTGKQIWHYENSVAYTEALPMIGLTHYMKAESPSPFLSGGAGVGAIAFFTDDVGGGTIGPATYLSGGYEFARHFNLEVGVAATWVQSTGIYDAYLTLNVLGY